jgi:protocatechuate 3,4-dioxygenase beta subunit/5-hydroxyisourate hydrolase-like protein (transthyretin family)
MKKNILFFLVCVFSIVCLRAGAEISLAGTVYYPDKKSAPGAKVEAMSWSNWQGPVATVTSDEQGQYSFEDLKPGSYWLYAKKGNFFSFLRDIRIVKDKPLSGKDITLEEGGRVKGIVLEDATGQPMANVLLVMDDGDRVYTDEKGEFLFEGIARKDHRVMAVYEGYARAFAAFDSKDREEVTTEIKMKPGGTIKGKLTDKAGNPLIGADVGDIYSGAIWHCAFGKTKTDEKGEYEIQGYSLEKPIWAFRASYPGLLEVTKSEIAFPKDSNVVIVNFELEEGWEIKGKVVDSKGGPINKALVAYGSSTSYVHYKSTTTDESGNFHLKNLNSGKDLVVIQAKGFSPELMEVTPGKDDNIPNLSITLQPGHFIAGTIVNENGEPIKDVHISVMAPCDLPTCGCAGTYRYLRPRGTTDENGYFKLEDLPAKGVYADIYAENYSSISDKFLEADKDDYRLTMTIPGHISGKVIDAGTGKPVKDFTVKLSFPQERKPEDIRAGFAAYIGSSGVKFQNEDGTFTISDLTTNAVFRVIVEAPDFTPAYIDRITVRPVSQKGFDTLFELKSGIEIEGIVVDSLTGKPVPRAKVTILDPLGRYSSWFSWSNYKRGDYHGVVKKEETDSEGGFVFSGVNPVKVDVLITHDDYGNTRLMEIDLSQEQNQKKLKLSLDPAGSIEGIVCDEGGKPLPNVRINLNLMHNDRSSTSYDSVSSDENGYYRFVNLPSGTYFISKQEENRFRRKEITLKPGENRTVDFGMEEGVRLYGMVMHKGKGLDGVKVSVVDEEKRATIATAGTDKDGIYEIKGLESMEYKVQAQKGEWVDPNKLYLEENIVLKEETKLDFTFPEGCVSGVVKDVSIDKVAANIPVQAFKRTVASEIYGKDHIGTVDDEWSWRPLQRTNTSIDGTFKMENMPAGRYVILAGDYNASNKATSNLITVKEKAEIKNVSLEINHLAQLRVKVVDYKTNKPLEKSSIALYSAAGIPLYFCSPRQECDESCASCSNPAYFVENGEVTIENLQPGRYYVMAGAANYLFSDKKGVRVSDRRDSAITLKLKPAGKAVFNLIEPDGSPVTGFVYMTLKLERTDRRPALKTLYGTQNGTIAFFQEADGKKTFVLDALEKGQYRADIEIYRENSRYSISYRFQKPLYFTSKTFRIEPEKGIIVDIDMNKF